MKKLGILVSLLVATLFVGCEQTANVSSPTLYELQNVRFSHPDNWKVTEDVAENGFRYIFVETSGDAIFIIQLFEDMETLSLEEFSKEFSKNFSKGIQQELEGGEFTDSTYSEVEHATAYGNQQGFLEKFTLTYAGQKVPHLREYYAIETGNKVAFLITQVATADASKVKPGFSMILKSIVFD